MTRLPEFLAKYGCRVEFSPGWSTRGSDSFNPRATIAHWTAGGRGDRGSLGICINGRAGLPGPLCNTFLTRAGVVVVVAAGRANHAGTGGWRGLAGNSSVLGTEAENSGPGDPWTAAQRDAYPRVLAAHCDLMGRDASWVCRHMDWTSRKIDINTWALADLQARVAALLAAGGAAAAADLARPIVPPPSPGADGVWSRGESDGPAGAVNHIQWRLNVHGARIAQDGDFGPGTEAAVLAFQRSHGLAVDGMVGPITLAALNAAPVAPPPPPPPVAPAVPAYPGLTREGMRNSTATRAYQQRLRDRGWTISVDGDHGPATTRVIRAFQAEKGLGADGVGGPQTWTALWTLGL